MSCIKEEISEATSQKKKIFVLKAFSQIITGIEI